MHLPFQFYLYGRPFTLAAVGANGTVQFLSSQWTYLDCLPTGLYNYAILAYEDYITFDAAHTSGGMFTSISGTAPNRIFNIEWRRACPYSDYGGYCEGFADFEVVDAVLVCSFEGQQFLSGFGFGARARQGQARGRQTFEELDLLFDFSPLDQPILSAAVDGVPAPVRGSEIRVRKLPSIVTVRYAK